LLAALLLAACSGGETAPVIPTPSPNETVASPSASPSPTESAAPAEYVAGGNEPFWSVTTGATRVTYSSPEKLDGESLPATISQADGWTRFSAQMDGAPLILEVRKAACEDDMSGFAFSHEARLTRGDGAHRGCARLASEPQPRE
jgi:uncharacterized membrane protein